MRKSKISDAQIKNFRCVNQKFSNNFLIISKFSFIVKFFILRMETPFYTFEKERGAFFTDFAGWRLPLHFGSAIQEALEVRRNAGFFDITHMGRVIIRGKDSEKLISLVFTRVKVENGRGAYGFLVDQEGRVVDDVVIFKHSSEFFIAIFNASRKQKDIELILYEREKNSFDVEINDISDKTIFIALQGPSSPVKIQSILQKLKIPYEVSDLKRFSFIFDGDFFISRTGYTGEDGFEFFLHSDNAESVWMALCENVGVRPCGLAARDILRLEAGLVLYGQDIDEYNSPLGSHLEKFISPEFGRLREMKLVFEKNKSYLYGVVFDSPPIPKRGDRTNPDGVVTSSVFSVVLGKPIAFVRFKDIGFGGSLTLVGSGESSKSEGEGTMVGVDKGGVGRRGEVRRSEGVGRSEERKEFEVLAFTRGETVRGRTKKLPFFK